MKRPNLIIAGEAKAGTTALHAYLGQHPEVFMCRPKEPRYFAFRDRRPDFAGPMDEEWFNRTTVYARDDYYRLFEASGDKSVIGEASPIYMHIPGCAAAIAEELPQTKLIILLRNPAELAFSAYQHMVRKGGEQQDFERALEEEPGRAGRNWAWHWRYSQLGFVADNIEAFRKYFPREQVFFIKYDDFHDDNSAVLRHICEFLDISGDFPFRKTRANVNARPRVDWMREFAMNRDHWLKQIFRPLLPYQLRRGLINAVRRINMREVKVKIDSRTKARLTEMYAEDIRRCEELTGLDLKEWLQPLQAVKER
jgi:hypothetical protein